MQTVILGAQGKLGGVLHRHAHRAGLGWRGQGRRAGADLVWTPDHPAPPDIFPAGGTLINMVGNASEQEALLSQANVDFTEQILDQAAAKGVAHVILASSAAVYGDAGDDPVGEDTALSPLTPYGQSKAEMEAQARAFADRPDSPAISILRIGNVAGSDALTAIAKARIAAAQPMALHRFADGTAPVRSYIGPKDLFGAVAALVTQPPAQLQTLNIAAPAPVDLGAVLSAYRAYVLPELIWQDTPAPEGIPPRVVLRTDALAKILPLPEETDYATRMARQVAEDKAL